jgi:hypothetical protein
LLQASAGSSPGYVSEAACHAVRSKRVGTSSGARRARPRCDASRPTGARLQGSCTLPTTPGSRCTQPTKATQSLAITARAPTTWYGTETPDLGAPETAGRLHAPTSHACLMT